MTSLDEDQEEKNEICCIFSSEEHNDEHACKFYTKKNTLAENFEYFKALFSKDHFAQNSNNEYCINTDAITMMKLFSTVLGNHSYCPEKEVVQSQNVVSIWLIYQQLEYLGWVKLDKIQPITHIEIQENLHANDPRLFISLFQLWKRNLLVNFKFATKLSFVQVGLSLKYLPIDDDINQKRDFADVILKKCESFCVASRHIPIVNGWSSITSHWVKTQQDVDIRWKFIKQNFKWAKIFESIHKLNNIERKKASIYMAGQCCFDMANLETVNELPKSYDFWIVGKDEYEKQLLCIKFLEAIKIDFPYSKIVIKFNGFVEIIVSENYVMQVIYSCNSTINAVTGCVHDDYSFMWFDGKILGATYNAWKDTFFEHKSKGVWDNLQHPAIVWGNPAICPISTKILSWDRFQATWNFDSFAYGQLEFYRLPAINIKDYCTIENLNWRFAKDASYDTLECYDYLIQHHSTSKIMCTNEYPIVLSIKGNILQHGTDFIQLVINEGSEQHICNFMNNLKQIHNTLTLFNPNLLRVILPSYYQYMRIYQLLKLPIQLTFEICILLNDLGTDYSLILDHVYLDWQ